MSCIKAGGLFAAGVLLLGAAIPAVATAGTSGPGSELQSEAPQITQKIDNAKLATVSGSLPLGQILATDKGALPDTQVLRNVTLLLKRSADKQSRYDAYVNQLSKPGSPNFHKWLTPTQIGTMFGPSKSDIAQVTSWLTSQGLKVDRVTPTGIMVQFSGSPSTIGKAFHTQLHTFTANGEIHFANVSEQQIPQALVPVVKGVVSLDNFFPKPLNHDVGSVTKNKATGKWQRVKASPNLTVPPGDLNQDPVYDVAPGDFTRIYNVNPLWGRDTPVRGAGQTVAVLERTDVLPADVATFRSSFLPGDALGAVSYVNPAAFVGDTSCPDPGTNPDEIEGALDAEWIGAAAPDANVVYASCDDSNSPSFGPFTAALNLLNAATPPPAIMSLSYGECEVWSVNDVTEDAGEIWQQAAAEGTTVFVSTGDAGSTVCDQGQAKATFGISVNTMSSTPWNVAVGGTDFDDYGNWATYWSPWNQAGGLSVLSYLPEQTWNQSCASAKLDQLIGENDPVAVCNTNNGARFPVGGGSGGPSTLWPQPIWQQGVFGAQQAHTRMQPDLSLFAAAGLYGHALVFCMSDVTENGTSCDYSVPDNILYNSAGGTSFAAPAMAGVQALINQAASQSHGNITPMFYDIAQKEYGTNGSPNLAGMNACNSSNGPAVASTCVFNDITVGDIDQPCTAGTTDCFSGATNNKVGVVSASGTGTLTTAWKTNAGYDYGTGLGSINAANLVDAVVAKDQVPARNYVAPGDFLNDQGAYNADGLSDIAIVDPVAGQLTSVYMRGSVALRSTSMPIAKGYSIGASGFFAPVKRTGVFTDQTDRNGSLAWTGPDNQLYLWLSDGNGTATDFLTAGVSAPYPAGWSLIGGGDFDGAGRQELLWRNDATGQIGWWNIHISVRVIPRSDAPPLQELVAGATISPLISAASGYVATVADLNGDGYADIVWTNPNDNSVYVWINNQQGDFTRHRIQDHAPGFVLYGAGSINGDGNTDLIWTNPTGHQMGWWIMNGFTVTDQQTRNVTPGYTMSSIADYNGDGLADILWVGQAGDVYEWQGTGGGFVSARVADPYGVPLTVPAGSSVQAVKFQGSPATGGVAYPLAQ
jgi:hypothetical protein